MTVYRRECKNDRLTIVYDDQAKTMTIQKPSDKGICNECLNWMKQLK
jgi:hypothetical protein